MYKKQAQAAFTPVSNFCSAPDFLYSDVMGNRKTTQKDRPTKPTMITLKMRIFLQVIQFVDREFVNTRS